MNTRILSLAASLAFTLGGAALAQPAAGPEAGQAAAYSVALSAVGRWLYDLKGNRIGSVRKLEDGGRTAVIMVGSYFQPGSHEARVPADALSAVGGKVVLHGDTVQALNTASRQ
jgi:hypothetical protein